MREKKYLIYNWYNQLYAISIDEVTEIIDIETMVKTSRSELKISSYNNRVLPVLDPVAIFSIKESDLTKKSKIMVLENQNKNIRFGMLIDEIIGVENFDTNEIEEAEVNEKIFVKGKYKGIRIIDPGHFLTSKMINLIGVAANMDLDILLNGIKAFSENWKDKEFLMKEIKMEMINLLLVTNRKKTDQTYIDQITRIHQMLEKI